MLGCFQITQEIWWQMRKKKHGRTKEGNDPLFLWILQNNLDNSPSPTCTPLLLSFDFSLAQAELKWWLILVKTYKFETVWDWLQKVNSWCIRSCDCSPNLNVNFLYWNQVRFCYKQSFIGGWMWCWKSLLSITWGNPKSLHSCMWFFKKSHWFCEGKNF